MRYTKYFPENLEISFTWCWNGGLQETEKNSYYGGPRGPRGSQIRIGRLGPLLHRFVKNRNKCLLEVTRP